MHRERSLRRWPSTRARGGGRATRLGLAAAAATGLFLPLATATPALALTDLHCGTWYVVRTSLHYQACTYTKGGKVESAAHFQNNHGSAVKEAWTSGYSLNNDPVEWGSVIDDTIPTGSSYRPAGDPPLSCITARLVVKASAVAGDPPPWGTESVAPPRSWPC